MKPLPPLSRRIREVLISNPWFADLPDRVRTDVMSRVHGRSVAAGERVFVRGNVPDTVFCVLEGLIQVGSVTSDGREVLLDFYGPGTWFGEVSLLAGKVRTHDAHACEAGLVLQLGGRDVEYLLATYPEFSRSLLRLESERLLILLDALQIKSGQTMEQWLAHRLLLLAGQHGVSDGLGIVLPLPLTQETLARLAGTTRQRIGQIVKEWERLGLVRHQYGKLVLRDRARLEALLTR